MVQLDLVKTVWPKIYHLRRSKRMWVSVDAISEVKIATQVQHIHIFADLFTSAKMPRVFFKDIKLCWAGGKVFWFIYSVLSPSCFGTKSPVFPWRIFSGFRYLHVDFFFWSRIFSGFRYLHLDFFFWSMGGTQPSSTFVLQPSIGGGLLSPTIHQPSREF